MRTSALRLYIAIEELKNALKLALKNESGQDMVEYALVMGLIAMGAVAAMKGFATTISTGLTSIGTKLTTDTS